MKSKMLGSGRALVIGACIAAFVIVAGALLYAFEPWNSAAGFPSVQPKEHMQDYGWDELSAIAGQIGASSSEDEAVRLAARYGLCDESGSISPNCTKAIVLADGAESVLQLVGIRHDERSDGGMAGLTFACADAPRQHAMNHGFENPDGDDADSEGGWQASDMRSWLDGVFAYELPADLRARIVRVQKRTANQVNALDELDEPGRLAGSSADWVSQTGDALWLFSASELCGSVPARDDLGIDATMSAVYAGEGAQYRWFADAGISAFSPNEALVRTSSAGDANPAGQAPCTWWLRSKTLEFGDGFWLVGTDGAPLNGIGEDARVAQDPSYVPDEVWGPDHARGVVFGFCL